MCFIGENFIWENFHEVKFLSGKVICHLKKIFLLQASAYEKSVRDNRTPHH